MSRKIPAFRVCQKRPFVDFLDGSELGAIKRRRSQSMPTPVNQCWQLLISWQASIDEG